MSDTLTPIRKMCAEFDVTPRALRFYEDEGLLSPVRKRNARWYSSADRARLALVLRGKKYGFTITQIRTMMTRYDPETRRCSDLPALQATAKHQLERLVRRQRDLTAAIDDLCCDLDAAAHWLDGKAAQAN